MDLNRYPDQNDLDYHRRLVYAKLVDKTLSETDYTELAPLVYGGQQYSTDVARRMMYGSCKTLQLMDSIAQSKDSTDDVINKIEMQRRELEKQRQRFFDQRRQYNKYVTKEGRRQHLEDRIVEAATTLNDKVSLAFDNADHSYVDGTQAVIVFTDWHYGMVTDNIFNKYNTSICEQRVGRVVEKAIERICLHGCSRLHVVILGDLIHGAIHVSARVQAEQLACDQIMCVSEILARAIAELSKHVDTTIVYSTYGNHARTIQNKNDSVHADNMERIIPWWLKQRLSSNRNITIAEYSKEQNYSGLCYVEAAGHGIVFAHGDLDGVRTSARIIPTLFKRSHGVDVEYILLGDKHHIESFEQIGVRAMVVGSLCGTDDYANDHRLYSLPGQALYIFNREDGIDAEYNIRC